MKNTMRLKLITLMLPASLFIAACGQQPTARNEQSQQATPSGTAETPKVTEATSGQSGNLHFLREYKGKYPDDIRLLEHPEISRRLKAMLGNETYALILGIWEVETPVEIESDVLYTWGMQAHSGGDPGVVFMADINRNILYIGIRQDGTEQLFAEDGGSLPARLTEWSEEQ
jgi:hypothetical protein